MTKRGADQRPAAGRGWLRIVGGAWRGRRIAVAATPGMRPTNERAREALFNRLMHARDTLGVELRGARVADVFAGSGALGLEALSRGAATAVFIERDPATCTALRAVLRDLGADDKAEVMTADATAPPPAARACDIVFLDAPYGEDITGATLAALAVRGWLRAGALAVTETEAPLAAPSGFTLIDSRAYGRAMLSYLRFGGGTG